MSLYFTHSVPFQLIIGFTEANQYLLNVVSHATKSTMYGRILKIALPMRKSIFSDKTYTGTSGRPKVQH